MFALIFDSVSGGEWLVLLAVVLVVVGPKNLPSCARKIGRMMSSLRRAADEFKRQIMTMDQEMRSTVDEAARDVIDVAAEDADGVPAQSENPNPESARMDPPPDVAAADAVTHEAPDSSVNGEVKTDEQNPPDYR